MGRIARTTGMIAEGSCWERPGGEGNEGPDQTAGRSGAEAPRQSADRRGRRPRPERRPTPPARHCRGPPRLCPSAWAVRPAARRTAGGCPHGSRRRGGRQGSATGSRPACGDALGSWGSPGWWWVRDRSGGAPQDRSMQRGPSEGSRGLHERTTRPPPIGRAINTDRHRRRSHHRRRSPRHHRCDRPRSRRHRRSGRRPRIHRRHPHELHEAWPH
jgi:hypothetical protein